MDDRGKGGRTTFHSAARGNQVEAVEILLKRGASINDRDNCDETAFHLAAHSNRVEAMQFLLKHDASVNIRNRKNQTPVDIVLKGNNQKAKNMFINCNNENYHSDENKITVKNSL